MIRRLLVISAASFLAAHPVVGQTPPVAARDSMVGRLSGTVRDSLGLPVAGASIMITPGGAIMRTDDSGTYVLRQSPLGRIRLNLRRLGFLPVDTQATALVDADNVVDIVMRRLPQQLEAVVVRGDRQCARYSLEGLLCRREVGHGHFIGYEQILAKKPVFLGDILRDEPGFRVAVNRRGRTVTSTVAWRCIKTIVDGDEIKLTNPAPRPQDVFAVEVYQRGEYPPEYWHWPWRGAYPCTLVVYWTKRVLGRGLDW